MLNGYRNQKWSLVWTLIFYIYSEKRIYFYWPTWVTFPGLRVWAEILLYSRFYYLFVCLFIACKFSSATQSLGGSIILLKMDYYPGLQEPVFNPSCTESDNNSDGDDHTIYAPIRYDIFEDTPSIPPTQVTYPLPYKSFSFYIYHCGYHYLMLRPRWIFLFYLCFVSW